MNTEPIPDEKGPDTAREAWSSPLPEPDHTDTTQVLHPRADGEDADFEALEMEHRGRSAQR